MPNVMTRMSLLLSKSIFSSTVTKFCSRAVRRQAFSSHTTAAEALPNKSPVWSCNEWDQLEEVIVGRPDNAVIPELRAEVKACIAPEKIDFYSKNGGRMWSQVIPKEHWRKIHEEVEEFCRVLQGEGIEVKRPEVIDWSQSYKTPYFESKGLYCAMPRDILMVVADEIIEATMTWRCRFFEYRAYRKLLKDYWRRGARWTAAPKPECSDALFKADFAFENEKERSELAENGHFVLTEEEPVFDAADFLRCGLDLFCQRSQVTNLSGIEWVRRHLAPRGFKVHQLEFHDPRPMHIDATFGIVRPGIVLENPERPCKQIGLFRKAGWDVVQVPQPCVSSNHPLWLGSRWLSMNTIMLAPDRVIVEKEEPGIQKMFANLGVKPIPVTLRHANSIGGGFHCWTCDVRRKGTLQSYFK